MGDVFAFLAKFTWPWAPTQSVIFLIQAFLETGLSSESLESLIDFLAYLEPKLWLKNQYLTKIKSIHERYNFPSGQNLASHFSAAD